MIRDLPLYLCARLVLATARAFLTWSRLCDRWADAATTWAGGLSARAKVLADRLQRRRDARKALAPGDLLHGSRAIAAHLGVRRSLAVHLIRAGLIPWFSLGGVACARRSTLAAHFAALERGATDEPVRPDEGQRVRS